MAETAEKKKISMIPAKPQYDRSVKLADKRMKVAAYCRISTELEQQESSYEAQVEYYTNKIEENPNWKNAGIYADDGKSATNTKKRDNFNAMIGDALDGKIEMILTKSVSRFARNTVDALITIRKLKEKNVAVVFEKEGVNTLDGTGGNPADHPEQPCAGRKPQHQREYKVGRGQKVRKRTGHRQSR